MRSMCGRTSPSTKEFAATKLGELCRIAIVLASATASVAFGQAGNPAVAEPVPAVKAKTSPQKSNAKPLSPTVKTSESVTPVKAKASTQKSKETPAQPKLKIDSSSMQTRWLEVRAAIGPKNLLKLTEEFERDYPFSAVDQQNQALQVCARKTLDIARTAGLSSDFFDETVGDANYKAQLKSSVRGEKEAAYQLARAYLTGTSGVAVNVRRAEQWLRFAADLDHARASWELAEIYNREGFMADAARYEKKAADLGYVIPPRLPSRGY